MERQYLLTSLDLYQKGVVAGTMMAQGFSATQEIQQIERLRAFVLGHKDCFSRSNLQGHITGSAMVTNTTFDRVLLTLHGKLKKWLQLGGHSDDDPYTYRVALREAEEESGLSQLQLVCTTKQGNHPIPFDIDIHEIPAHGGEPPHYHYDLRYVIIANPAEPLVISKESKDLAWFSLEDARKVTSEVSMLRQFAKLERWKALGLTKETVFFRYSEPRLRGSPGRAWSRNL